LSASNLIPPLAEQVHGDGRILLIVLFEVSYREVVFGIGNQIFDFACQNKVKLFDGLVQAIWTAQSIDDPIIKMRQNVLREIPNAFSESTFADPILPRRAAQTGIRIGDPSASARA
jgi:hypothetical protein